MNSLGFEFWTIWSWLALGLLLVIIEVFAPGVVFVWLGIAAIVLGLIVGMLPGMGWETQIALFAVLSVVSVLGGRAYIKRNPVKSDDNRLNRRAEQYIDRTFVLAVPIENGYGKLVVDDSTWKIKGDDLPVGAKVKVVGADSTVLNVVAVD